MQQQWQQQQRWLQDIQVAQRESALLEDPKSVERLRDVQRRERHIESMVGEWQRVALACDAQQTQVRARSAEGLSEEREER